jgi:hypothetical protein
LEVETIDLNIQAQLVNLSARVRSSSKEPVAGARVLFEGTEVGAGRFTLLRQTDALGNLQQSLVPGAYRVTVAPPGDQPFAMASVEVEVGVEGGYTAEDVLDIVVPNKVRLSGVIKSYEGHAVAKAHVLLRRQHSALAREFSTTSTESGAYSVDVDPGAALYDLIVEPRQGGSAPLPRYQRVIDVGSASAQTHAVHLWRASLVYGRLVGAKGEPLANGQIDFFSSDLGSVAEPLLVGSGHSNADGEFVIPLPTPQ